MLHFENKTEKCKSCAPAIGCKFMVIIIIGSVIGFAALRVVELPPNVLLIEQNKTHGQNTINILKKLNKIEENIVGIKENLTRVKRRLNNENQ